uniref:K Homology domain-containing protein n=1 Tax=Chromera velia CCMP2878 TaxID=1169474 RepID=A0A0G4HJR8_9ALVE|eukprot:Cvel_28356.t1-p1 / transcript=Cvel_28356.t1 / gene=Cvel_28356 / organism=Chromera_velia_CCMP2878 / gene_product=hypothetical protein / transcript_product=hypothetical protein / location=Cvel_scaffold3693:6119-9327(+) / protein_length=693 / sequence_SO=supercontig / SO=protein_coding / is_pseudo=false
MDDRIAKACTTYGVFNSSPPTSPAIAEGWNRITLTGVKDSVIDAMSALHDKDGIPLRILLPDARSFVQGENFRRQVEESLSQFGTQVTVRSLNPQSRPAELVLTISGPPGASLGPLRAFASSLFEPFSPSLTPGVVGEGQRDRRGVLSRQIYETSTHKRSVWPPTHPTYPQQLQTATATPGPYTTYGRTGNVGLGRGIGGGAGEGLDGPEYFFEDSLFPLSALRGRVSLRARLSLAVASPPRPDRAHVGATVTNPCFPPFQQHQWQQQEEEEQTLLAPMPPQPMYSQPQQGRPATPPYHSVQPIHVTVGGAEVSTQAQQNAGAVAGAGTPGGPPNPNQHQVTVAAGQTEAILWIPAHFVPRLVGGGGKCILDFQNRSGARLKYDRVTSVQGMKAVRIRGTERQVLSAVEIVENKIASWTARDLRGPVTRTLWVPDEMVNQVIGKKGAKISDFQLSSGASVFIDCRESAQMGRVRDITESLGLEAAAAQEMAVQIQKILSLTQLPMARQQPPSPNMPTRIRRVVLTGTEPNVKKCNTLLNDCICKVVKLAALHAQNTNAPPNPHLHPQATIPTAPHAEANPTGSPQAPEGASAPPPYSLPTMEMQQTGPSSASLMQPPHMHQAAMTAASGFAIAGGGAALPSSNPGMIAGPPPVHVQHPPNVYSNSGLLLTPTPTPVNVTEAPPPYEAGAPQFH